MAILTPKYNAALPAGFTSGTLEIRYPSGIYVDQAGRASQAYYRATIGSDRTLTNTQTGGTLTIIGAASGDPIAPDIQVVVTLNVTGLPSALRTTKQIPNVFTSGTDLDLFTPNYNVPTAIAPNNAVLNAQNATTAASNAAAAANAAAGSASTAAGAANSAAAAATSAAATISPTAVSAAASSAAAAAMSAVNAEWADTKSDIAQAQAANDARQDANDTAVAQAVSDAAAAAGLIPTTATSTTLPNAAGNYRITTGAEAGQVWTRATAGATPTRSAGLETASPLYARTLSTGNLIPEGLDPLNNRVYSQVVSGIYVSPVSGSTTPFGKVALRTQTDKAAQVNSGRTGMTWLPITSAGFKARTYVLPGAGHNWSVSIIERNAAGTQKTTQLFSHLTTTRKIGTLGGYDVYEYPVTFNADSIEWSMYASFNYTSLAGYTDWGGLWVIPSDQQFADATLLVDRKIPNYATPDPMSDAQIQVALDTGWTGVYTPPTLTSPAYPYLRMFTYMDVGVMADVWAWEATGTNAYLERSIPMLDAYTVLRDDRLATPQADFTGVVRKGWGSDNYQSTTDGVYGSGVPFTNPPHPGVIAHWPLHTAIYAWAALRWVEAVGQAVNPSATLTTKATEVKAFALEAMHEFDAQFATEAHVTNTDPNPMQAGEGRYFLKYDPTKAGALREGYLYVPGAVELPLNMDMMMAAALYVAYRVTRGTALAPTAEASALLDKAERIMRRFKRSLYQMPGFKASTYYRQGTWVATGYTSGTANSPSNRGWTGYSSISTSPSGSQTIGEDMSHAAYNIRAISEARRSSSGVLTSDDLYGITGQLFNYFPHWGKRERYYLDNPVTVNTTSLTQSITASDVIWANLADCDPRVKKWLREWYKANKLTRSLSAGLLVARGVL